jgi:hypothetical protein
MRHWSIRRAMSVVETVMGEEHRGASLIARRGQTETSQPDAVPHPRYRPARPALQPDFSLMRLSAATPACSTATPGPDQPFHECHEPTDDPDAS